MSWFKKEEHVHFERNQEGRVTGGYRNGQAFKVNPNRKPEPKWKSSGQLEQEYYARQPKKIQRSPAPSRVTSFFNPLNRVDVVPVKYPLARRHPQYRPYYPKKTDRNPFHSMFDMGLPNAPRIKKPRTRYTVVKGKAYPIAGSTSKKKKTKRKDQLLGFDMLGNNWRL